MFEDNKAKLSSKLEEQHGRLVLLSQPDTCVCVFVCVCEQ